MEFLKSLLETVANFDEKDEWYAIRYQFKDLSNPEYPIVNIWNNGEIEIQDTEGRSCFASDEQLLAYINKLDDELLLIKDIPTNYKDSQ